MQALSERLQSITVGQGVTHANLTLFPLLRGDQGAPDYLTLDQTLAGGTLRIQEVSEAGSVPTLRAVNDGDRPVLLLDGEELVGAKQNRVLNLTILVPARSTLDIPVSCVEQGRWSHRGGGFSASGSAHYASGRAYKTQTVSEALRAHRQARSDQGGVWRDISAKAERMGVESATLAMAAMYDDHHESVEDYVKALPPLAGQCGAVFTIGAAAAGLDLFDNTRTLAGLLPKLVRSYALDAIETAGAGAPPVDRETAVEFLSKVREARAESFPAVGLGQDLRLAGPDLAGGALTLDGKLVHLCAFRVRAPEGHEEAGGARLARASRRGRYRG